MEMPHLESPSSARVRKAWVETYGCQMNVSDGELMQGVLAARGWVPAASPEEADVILVNTCAIRDHAEQRVLGRVGELNRLKLRRPDVIIGVTGCMAQRMGERLLERAPYVDLVMGPDGYRALPDVLDRLSSPQAAAKQRRGALPVMRAPEITDASQHAERMAVLDFSPGENYEGLEVRRSSSISAWVPVQRGCNHRCTFCIVPYVRGPEKNRAPEHVLEEVRSLAGQGITEVVLLGQTVNSWTFGAWRFPQLLRAVARVDGIRRVRFTSPHPGDVTPELIAVMAEEPAVCKQLHLPVQSGHDRTLKRMLRRYTVAGYLETVRQVRTAIPHIALSTDVIVAFPGESEAEYEATLDLVRLVRYDDAFLYKYSPREGTPATRLPREQFIAADVAQHRLARLIDVQRAIQAEINSSAIGSEVEVLVERTARSAGDLLGRTDAYKVAAFPGDSALIGRYVRVRLVSTTGATFRAVPVDGPARLDRVA
jgi:tRNA-2-methylthio-N6-dimethylallyladenosine synthase